MTGVGEKREVGGRGRERSNWSATAVLGIAAPRAKLFRFLRRPPLHDGAGALGAGVAET